MIETNKGTLMSKFEEDTERELRKTFDNIPILQVGDIAILYRDITVKVCNEYVEKSEEYKKEWALNIVRGMFGESDDKLN